jgi:hypothetical protein
MVAGCSGIALFPWHTPEKYKGGLMGMHDRDWYKEAARDRDRKLSQQRQNRFRFRLPVFRKRYDLSAYNFEKPPGLHPVWIALIWAVVFLVLFVIIKHFRH